MNRTSDLESRTITQHRDDDEQFPEVGKGGNFYLQVNGRNFLVRGAVYTPDLLYRYDPARETTVLRYVKNLGLNMLRWESKIASEHIVEEADEEGIPLLLGWMCCNQWEKWDQWSAEDHKVAGESLRSQILMLRGHASVFLWRTGAMDWHRCRCGMNITGFCRSCTGKTPWWTRCHRLRAVRMGTANGMASTCRDPTAGGRRPTGSAGGMPQLGGPARSRETMRTFRRTRA